VERGRDAASPGLFFEVFGLVAQGAPGTEGLREGLTQPWLRDAAAAAAESLGLPPDRAALRLGIAVTRGLLLELVAGAEPAEIDAAHRLFVAPTGKRILLLERGGYLPREAQNWDPASVWLGLITGKSSAWAQCITVVIPR
jgi:hypothetical protein